NSRLAAGWRLGNGQLVYMLIDPDGFARDLDTLTGGYSTRVMSTREFGMALDRTDQIMAGWANQLTDGGSTWLREAMYGEYATRNHQGEYFELGQAIGDAHNIAFMLAGSGPRGVPAAGGGFAGAGRFAGGAAPRIGGAAGGRLPGAPR